VIEFRCNCANPAKLPESAVGKKVRCPKCGKSVQIVAGESLPDGAGLGDFDASLVAAPSAVMAPADRYILGGAAEIHIGKLGDRHIILPGQKVSRQHCTLVRVDFGPSVWKILDFNSTNGVIVNGQRVIEHQLQDGDILTIGEYSFQYSLDHVAGDIAFPRRANMR
jgi:hypothetical protein